MSDEVLKALGELALRCQMVERETRDLEVKVKRLRRAVRRLSFCMQLLYVVILFLSIGVAVLARG